MPTERSKPRFQATWILAVTAGLMAVGVSVWGATHQSSPEEVVDGASRASSPPSPTTSAEPDPSGRPSGEPVADARTRLRSALASWRDADTGAFTQTSTIPGIGRLTLTGVYQLSTRSSEVTQVFAAEDEEPVDIRFVGTQGVTYLNSPDWGRELRSCWMRFDARVLAESTGISMVNGAASLPANVIALSHARAARVDPTDSEVVVGTVRLADAAPLFGSSLVQSLRLATLDAPVAAEFRLVDGAVASWRISGRSMSAALASENALAEPSGVLLAAVASYDVEVEYDEVGVTEVDVRAPAPELQMSHAQAQSDAGCPASR